MHTTGNEMLITVKDITICYDDNGKGELPIIFIHGFPFNKSSWLPQVEFFKKTQRVINYDIRGFGRSTAGAEKFSIPVFADDLVNFMDALQLQKAIICGFSMGGYILLNFANRYPERVAALILSDTQCNADSAEAKAKRHKTIKQVEAGELTDFTENTLNSVFCKETDADKKEVVEKIKKVILSASPVSITGALHAMADRWDVCDTLSAISVPTLILCGKEDIPTPPAQSEFMQEHIKGSTLHIIEQAGHLSNLEQPEEFNKMVNAFILGLK